MHGRKEAGTERARVPKNHPGRKQRDSTDLPSATHRGLEALFVGAAIGPRASFRVVPIRRAELNAYRNLNGEPPA
jgi:hypothetical protein